jgi:hypothetical protein
MFENIFPQGTRSKSPAAVQVAAAYDGVPHPRSPLRLIQHIDAPCWQAHAYLVTRSSNLSSLLLYYAISTVMTVFTNFSVWCVVYLLCFFQRFINQPYWTENIVFDVAMGVDTPVLVDRQCVMSAQPALRCMEEVAAAAASAECNPSFTRHDCVTRLQALWRLLEARQEVDGDKATRHVPIFGLNSLTKMYANMKKHFFLTR